MVGMIFIDQPTCLIEGMLIVHKKLMEDLVTQIMELLHYSCLLFK